MSVWQIAHTETEHQFHESTHTKPVRKYWFFTGQINSNSSVSNHFTSFHSPCLPLLPYSPLSSLPFPFPLTLPPWSILLLSTLPPLPLPSYYYSSLSLAPLTLSCSQKTTLLHSSEFHVDNNSVSNRRQERDSR